MRRVDNCFRLACEYAGCLAPFAFLDTSMLHRTNGIKAYDSLGAFFPVIPQAANPKSYDLNITITAEGRSCKNHGMVSFFEEEAMYDILSRGGHWAFGALSSRWRLNAKHRMLGAIVECNTVRHKSQRSWLLESRGRLIKDLSPQMHLLAGIRECQGCLKIGAWDTPYDTGLNNSLFMKT